MLLKTALFFWYNNWKRHLFLSNSLYHIPPKNFAVGDDKSVCWAIDWQISVGSLNTKHLNRLNKRIISHVFFGKLFFADRLKFPLLKKIRILQSKIQLFHLYDPNENKNMIEYFFADNKSYYPNLDDSSKSNFGLRSGRAKNSVVTMKVIVQGTLGVLFPATAMIV